MTDPITESDYLGRIQAAARNLTLPSLLRLRSMLDAQVDETADAVSLRIEKTLRERQRQGDASA
jgi:hypothetical protein